MTDFELFFTPDHLASIFKSIQDGHYDVIKDRCFISSGADRIELDLFLRDQDLHLRSISRRVLAGRYIFRPFLEREIPKADSKDKRTISIRSEERRVGKESRSR